MEERALETFQIKKSDFEALLSDGATVTDEQWLEIAGEIDERVGTFIDYLLPMLAEEVTTWQSKLRNGNQVTDE
jgi:hypothetical protein